VDETFERTVRLLRERRDALERIARKLLEKETLDEKELAALARMKPVAAANA
jgi:cell division protease FtsH